MKCKFCSNKADGITYYKIPICIDCLFDNPQYEKAIGYKDPNEQFKGMNMSSVVKQGKFTISPNRPMRRAKKR